VRDVPERAAQQRRRGNGADQLRQPITDGAPPGEVTCERERERHGGVEMRPRDMSDRVDHRHDHQPEGDRDADMAKRMRPRIHHHCTSPREHQSEGANRLSDERSRERHHRH